MARWAVQDKSVSIVLACTTFGISETCYRYRPMRSDENEEIADWLLRLTACHKRWGFGLCFLYLRNVKGFGWNHKRVYRIYRELELNLRIKPRRLGNRSGCIASIRTRYAGSGSDYRMARQTQKDSL